MLLLCFISNTAIYNLNNFKCFFSFFSEIYHDKTDIRNVKKIDKL